MVFVLLRNRILKTWFIRALSIIPWLEVPKRDKNDVGNMVEPTHQNRAVMLAWLAALSTKVAGRVVGRLEP